jgi:hypothetical protein
MILTNANLLINVLYLVRVTLIGKNSNKNREIIKIGLIFLKITILFLSSWSKNYS